MKIALVGKGGSGKTTLTSLLVRRLAVASDRPALLAVDADINQHLAAALGLAEEESVMLPTLGDHLDQIKQYLRGSNPRIGSAAEMIKTTPAGRGSNLLRVGATNPLYEQLVRRVGGVPLMVTGPFMSQDLGVACYHSKVGAVELMLNHLVDGPGEYVVVDMTAGADSFASGLFTRFDLTLLVCEPTLRSVAVYRQYVGYAREFGVRVAVVGNKIDNDDDVAFLREHVGSNLLACVSRSGYIRAAERGDVRPLSELEPANARALDVIRAEIDTVVKDWPRYTEQAAQFHLRNAAAWANDRAGRDLAGQVDPDFVLGPAALAAVLDERNDHVPAGS